jgi:hypothetical protein
MRHGMTNKTDVRKSPELLTRENAELSNALRKSQVENQGLREMMRELGKILSFVVNMHCGGRLTLSTETLRTLARAKSFDMEITEDVSGNRTYSTKGLTKSDRVQIAQTSKKLTLVGDRK